MRDYSPQRFTRSRRLRSGLLLWFRPGLRCRGSATGGTDHQALHGPELGSGGMGLAARGSPHRGTRAPAWGELPRARAAVLPRRLLSLRGQCAGQGAAGPPLPGKRDLCAGIARAEVQGLMAAAMAMAAAIAADGLTVTMAAAMAASNYNYTSGHGGGYMAAAMAMAIWLRWRLRRPLTVTMAAATAASNFNYTGGHGGGYMAAAIWLWLWLRRRLRRPLTVSMAAAMAASNSSYGGGHGGV